jgi:hypothetical protein
VLAAQCLDRRISDKQTIVDQVNAWTKSRNAANGGADWRFTTAEARISGQVYQIYVQSKSATWRIWPSPLPARVFN